MHALILAAGRGSRLGALTAQQPKCLTALAGRTLLDWQLATLRAAGIRDITVVTGYQSQVIEKALASTGVSTMHNADWERTNMVASLMCAQTLLRADHCVVSYSDIVFHPQIAEALIAANGELCVSYDTIWLALWRQRFSDPLEDAETFRVSAGNVAEIGRRAESLAQIEGQYMGLLKCTPAGFDRLNRSYEQLDAQQRVRIDVTSLLGAMVEQGESLRAVPVSGRWCEVDSATDLTLYERLLADTSAHPWPHDWRWS